MMAGLLAEEREAWAKEFEKITKKLRDSGYDFSKVYIYSTERKERN